MRIIRLIWAWFWAVLATTILFLPMTIAALLSNTGNLAFNISKLWANIMVRVTAVQCNIRGREKIKPGRSYIIITNHQSLFDILALVTKLGIQFRWVIKKEVLKIPLFGYALWAAKNIFIDRSDRRQAIGSMKHGLERLPGGASVMVFAEGTRSPDGEIHPFKKGGFVMAVDNRLPILPVTINGSRKVLPKGDTSSTPGPIEVVVADPIDTANYTHDNLEELIRQTRDTVIANFNLHYPERRHDEKG
ncbi:MAG: 1-acyl-sn-glycerol-3-phosphate acyltransferase [Deltaproteobacteria bacterium]|nr:1-acyl-sn-glycerol-3-phosphate acyltransferase [Deltaproteobacteria bacterium]